MERRDVSFSSQGVRCAAWLYTPEGAGPHPIAVLAHGFGGVRTARLWAFAERFAAAGVAALVFDYRHFGSSGGQPRQLLDIDLQLEDWRAAIACARALDGIDRDRVALWGSSFSGGHVAVLAAEDHGVAAAVSQGAFLDGLWVLRVAGPRNALRLTVAGIRDEAGRLFGRPAYMIPIVGPPGSVAAINSPGAEQGYRALFPQGAEFRNEVAARIGLRIASYRPIRHAAAITCPWLVCVVDGDVVTPPQPALKAAGLAPRGEARRYEGAHFEIYVGELFERIAADQIEFLGRHLLRTRRFGPAQGAPRSPSVRSPGVV
jgi:pimeloyl-ACP methyl ester carboxylesterase